MNCEAMIDDIKSELNGGDWTPEGMIQDFTDTVWKAVNQLNEEKYEKDEKKLQQSALDEARVEFCDALDTYLEMIEELRPIDKKTLEEAKTKVNHKLCKSQTKEDRIDTIDKVIQDFLKSLG